MRHFCIKKNICSGHFCDCILHTIQINFMCSLHHGISIPLLWIWGYSKTEPYRTKKIRMILTVWRWAIFCGGGRTFLRFYHLNVHIWVALMLFSLKKNIMRYGFHTYFYYFVCRMIGRKRGNKWSSLFWDSTAGGHDFWRSKLYPFGWRWLVTLKTLCLHLLRQSFWLLVDMIIFCFLPSYSFIIS